MMPWGEGQRWDYQYGVAQKPIKQLNAVGNSILGCTSVLLNGCAEGVTGSTRVGRQILMKRIEIAPLMSASGRVLLVLDTQARGAGLTLNGTSGLFNEAAGLYNLTLNPSTRETTNALWHLFAEKKSALRLDDRIFKDTLKPNEPLLWKSCCETAFF